MPQCVLSVHGVEGEVRAPMTDEEMQQYHKQVGILEEEMKGDRCVGCDRVQAARLPA